MRIDEAVGLTKRPAHYVIDAQLWNKFRNILRWDQLYILNAQRYLAFTIRLEIFQMTLISRAEEIAMCAVVCRMTDDLIEPREEIDRIARHLNVDGRGKLHAYATHALPRRSFALMCLALDYEHVGAALVSKVVGHA